MKKVPVLSVDGKKVSEIVLPMQFSEGSRPDLILRAVLSVQANQRQPYGGDPFAGKRTTAKMKTLRRAYGTWAGKGIARVSRIRIGSGHMTGVVRQTPQSVKGRAANPPKVERVWTQKINKKERRKAIRAAISATADAKIVSARGHRIANIKDLPIIIEDKMQTLKKAKDVQLMLEKIGLVEELSRASEKNVRAGKGKRRGRKYKGRVGPIIVVAEDKGIVAAAKNIAGVDVLLVNNLNAMALAPGAKPGRLAIFSKASIEKLEKEKLFA